jgi:hypothetical protein
MKRLLPVFALAMLSPFIAEILFGATPLSRFASLPPLIFLYGGGAVLIRELARRIGPGWDRIVWLAAAYALVEEGLVMQTFFSPDLFNASTFGGRAMGVNWLWVEALIGYHIAWSISIPIAIVEICFPERRTEPWLGRAGTTIALICYMLGALAIAFTFRRFVTPHFQAPALHVMATVIIAANAIAWALRKPAKKLVNPILKASSTPVPTVLPGIVALFIAGLWLQLFNLPQPIRSGMPMLLPMFLEGCLIWVFATLLRAWTAAGRNWTDLHSMSLVTGALMATMIYGFAELKAASPFDRGGQLIACIVTLLFLGVLAHRVHNRLSPLDSREASTHQGNQQRNPYDAAR